MSNARCQQTWVQTVAHAWLQTIIRAEALEAAQVCKLGCQIALRCHVRWPPSLQIFCTLFAPSRVYLLGTPGLSLAAAV